MVIQRRIVTAAVVLCITYLSLTLTAYAQDSGEVKVYRTQFIELHAKVQTVFTRAEQEVKVQSDPRSILNLRQEILALRKLVHRLDEEAGSSDVKILESGQDSNKTLLFTSQGCIALDFVLTALDNFLETQDRAFLGLAKDGEDLARTVQKIL